MQRWLKVSIVVLSFLMIVVLGGPFTAFLVGPSYEKKKKTSFVEVAGFSDLVEERPMKLSFQNLNKDTFLKSDETDQVWVIKHSTKKATVFSPICPHLGCRYNFDASQKKFICPCHASVFALSGAVLAGPAPRPLDTLPYEIRNDQLYVQWELFKPGLSKKVKI